MCTFEQTDTRNIAHSGRTNPPPSGSDPSKRSRSTVTLRHWRVFHAVHDCGSFSDAAALLHLTQPAVCYTVGVLEEYVGVPLYRIEGRRVVVTDDGKKLLSLSRHLLKNAINLEIYAKKLSTCIGDRLQVLVENLFPRSGIAPVLGAFIVAHPESGALIEDVESRDIGTMIGKIPIGMAIGSKVPETCVAEPLARIEYVPVFHAARPFALPENITLADVHRFPRIAVRGEGDTMLTRSGRLYAPPVKKIAVANVDAVLERLLSCDAYAWLPKSMVERTSARARLRIVHLPDAERCERQFFLMRRAGGNHSPLLGDLADAIKKAFL